MRIKHVGIVDEVEFNEIKSDVEKTGGKNDHFFSVSGFVSMICFN